MMNPTDIFFDAIQIVIHEAALFAAAGFVILGISDMAVDLHWLVLYCKRPIRTEIFFKRLDDLPAPACPVRTAIFLPAWDESAVIGSMLRHSIRVLGEADYRIFVGCYANDPQTRDEVRAIDDPRIVLVVGERPGPSSKADCLNRLWQAMVGHEARHGRYQAVVLHDAEDVVHPDELRVFDSLIGGVDLVQLPVVPLLDPRSRWIAGHYADEFAEAHGKQMVVRAAIGAALPSAGVGCAFSRDALGEIAAARGNPFDADSLTEDYELGLRLGEAGRKAVFVRVLGSDGRLVATRGYFPATLATAVRQKARWMTGIALSGWDRLGWGSGFTERWMRFRDRQSVIAAILLAAAYLSVLGWGGLSLAGWLTGRPTQPFSDAFIALALIATGMLIWRLAFRFVFVARQYGFAEALRSPLRALIGNAITILAARRAISQYLAGRRAGRSVWDKTAHRFPVESAAE